MASNKTREQKIKAIREGCEVCGIRGTCAIPHTIDSIFESSEKDYGVMISIISFCGNWCPPVEMEEE